MPCDLLDLRCIFVNELIGNLALAGILIIVFYFAIAAKLRLGFDTTIMFSIPTILLVGLAIGALSPIMAFVTVIVGLMVSFVFRKIIGNR